MGDRGVSARVWHALSQVVQENDDSWQLTVWHPPLKKSSPTSPCVILPPPLSLFTSSHLLLSLYPSPSFSPFSLHADCGPIIAQAPVWIALHLWKSVCGLLVFLYMFLFGYLILKNLVFSVLFSLECNTSLLHATIFGKTVWYILISRGNWKAIDIRMFKLECAWQLEFHLQFDLYLLEG